MKSFREFRNPPKVEKIEVYDLDEDQLKEAEELDRKILEIYEKDGIQGIEKGLNEGLFGGALGFLIGPSIGRIIARALGVEKGILYDMFTSRLVSAALGSAIQNNAGKSS